jgi:hypothetical protein
VEYLDKLRGTVNIRRLMYEYRATVKTFADWLLKREREINAKILAEYDALEAEIAPLRSALAAEEIAASRESLNIEESWLPDVDDPPTTI